MKNAATAVARTLQSGDAIAVIDELGPRFAERAAAHDADDHFVAENYAELKAARLFALGVPGELGGGNAAHAELCDMLRRLAHYCGSTALAFSMHTHMTAINVWRWRHDKAPVDALLKRVAAEQIVLLSSGGSDWLPGSGKAEKVEGGFRITARKCFSSGAPSGDILMTSAVYDDPQAGPTVLHFGVPLKAEGVRLLDTWRTLGMRATGSHDIELDGVFVADGAIGVRRSQGKWHHLFHVISMVAFPLIYAVYVGLAEAARDKALNIAAGRKHDPQLIGLTGEMENSVVAARLALRHMVETAATATPGPATTNAIFIGRTLAGQNAVRAVELAMEVAGGASFYRDAGLERLFRDVQGARFHPLQGRQQQQLAGRLALGLDIDG
jgi:alkylation response protein AidB-like acyl-CoA dehydrogenase